MRDWGTSFAPSPPERAFPHLAIDGTSRSMAPPADPTLDAFHRGRFHLVQPRGGHRAGLDALLLAASVPDGLAGDVLDMGAGTGLAGLATADRHPLARVTLAERDPVTLAALRASLDLPGNAGLAARARVVPVDLMAPAASREAALGREAHDHALANPPFNSASHRSSPDARRAGAHDMDGDTLAAWCRAAAAALRPGGSLTMIVRPASLSGLLAAWGGRFGGPALLPVHTREGPATRLLARGAKGARAPLAMLPSLHVNDAFARALADGTAQVAM